MKRKLLLLLAGFAWFSSQGQLVNDGATIVIQPGATLFVESNFQNVSGTLNNQGTMEVMGDFSNDAGSSITNAGTIKFTGTTASNVILAGDALNNVEVHKTGGANVVLGDPMAINGGLTFNGANTGKIVLGAHDLTLGASVLAISGAGANSYINTSVPATGQLIKTMSSASAYTFPVGDGSFYTPVTATPSGTSGSVSVAVENAAPSNLGTNPNYLTRNWRVNTTGFTSNALVGTYNQTNDVVGTEALIKGATLTGMTWSFTGSTGTPASDLVGATAPAGDVVFSGLTTLGSVDIKAFLQGPFTVAAGGPSNDTMTTALNYKGYLATQLTSPYIDKDAAGGFSSPSVGSIPNNTITDWVQIQLINPSNTNDTIKKSAFITKFGDVVDLDGSSIPQILGAYEPSIVRLVHRNHLPVKTATSISTQVVSELNFTNNSNIFTIASFGSSTIKNDGQPQKEVETGKFALWAGDIRPSNNLSLIFGDGLVKYNGGSNDRAVILTKISAVPGFTLSTVVLGYHPEDLNLNGEVKYNGGSNDRSIILSNISAYPGFTLSSTISQHN